MTITIGEEVVLNPGILSDVSTSVTRMPLFPDDEGDKVVSSVTEGVAFVETGLLVASLLPLFMAAF